MSCLSVVDMLFYSRALDKREYLVIIRDNFCEFCIETYVVIPHLNRLYETVQMRVTTYSFAEKYDHLYSNTPSFLELCIHI